MSARHAPFPPLHRCLSVAVLAGCLVTPGAPAAAYRYKDNNGQWVYTDRLPATPRTTASIALGGLGDASPQMVVVPRPTDRGIALVAVNACQCTVEFAVQTATAQGLRTGRAVVGPQSEVSLLDVPAVTAPSPVRYEYGYVVGEPNVEHRPASPYRAPFALGRQYTVTQAAPDELTHRDASSRHAVDIAMPVGTAVHAARAGLVVNVARSHFRGGLDVAALSEANFVQMLHDDGTYAIYAHLQMDTARVRPGQRVARGEYIANSGNTGFTNGPHLHFAVLRNTGLGSESLPVSFAGPGGVGVTPQRGRPLVAY